MSFLTFIIFDLITFLIKLTLITIILLIFKDKIANCLLDRKFDKTFGKLQDNIMSINFDDLEISPDDNDSQTPTQF